MRTMMFLLLAVLPPSAMWAQDTKPTAPNAIPQAGQGSAKLGANLCGHVIDAGTFVDARAQNAAQEEAQVIRWLDPKGTAVHSALAMGRCVAKDGDTIDGKVIVRVLPNSLAVSNRHGLTAWEAEYREMYGVLGAGPSRRGAFSDSHFVTELDPSKASEPGSTGSADPDFRWNEEQEILALKPGVVLIPPPVNFSYRTAPPPCVAAPAKASGVMAAVKKHLERTLEKQAAKADADITKNTKGDADAGLQDITTATVNEAGQPQPCTPVAKGKGPSK